MKIEDYKNICDNVEVSDTCREGYHAAMEQICSENKKERKQLLKWQAWRKISKAAMFWGNIIGCRRRSSLVRESIRVSQTKNTEHDK